MKDRWQWKTISEPFITREAQRDIDKAELQFFGFKNDSITYEELQEIHERKKEADESHKKSTSLLITTNSLIRSFT